MKSVIMNKKIFFAACIAAVIVLSGCSNLFEKFMDDDEEAKTGDTSLSVSTTATETERRAILDSGLVVLKSSDASANQIAFTSGQNTYYVGENTALTSDYTNGTTSCITSSDETVIVKCLPNDAHAKVTSWDAEQTYKATWNSNSSSDTYTALSAEQPVSYTVTSGSDNKIITLSKSDLPYGTTAVTAVVTADDSYYKETYKVYLTKKHTSVALTTASSNTDITHGLVVIKATAPLINQITMKDGKTDYIVGAESDTAADSPYGTAVYLTGTDNTMTFKCYTTDSGATVAWTANQTKYSSVTTESKTSPYTNYITGEQINITRNTITGESMVDVDASHPAETVTLTSSDSTNQIVTGNLPYGVTVVTATVSSNDASKTYTITLTRKRYFSSDGESSSDTTSVLTGLTIATQNTTDTNGNTVTASSTTSSGIPFVPTQIVYHVNVDEDTDQITLTPSASSNVTISAPTAVTKYGSEPVNGYTVLLAGGVSKITFTVTEAGQESRTYMVYVVKDEDGVTTLSDLVWASLNTSGTYSAISSSNAYAAGVTSLSIDTTAAGGENSSSAKSYTVKASADNRVDVTQLAFTAIPTHKYTRLAYYVGDVCPSADSSNWLGLYTQSTEKEKTAAVKSASGISNFNNYQISMTLNNSGSKPTTTLWIKAVSKSYVHVGASIKTSDVRYHKIVVQKAGSSDTGFTAFYATKTLENGTTTDIGNRLISTSAIAYEPDIPKTFDTDNTYADIVTCYFRLLDQTDSTNGYHVYYTAENKKSDNSDGSVSGENKSFTGYAASKTEISDSEIYSSLSYYKLVLGEKVSGLDTITSKNLPNGTTTVKIYVGTSADNAILSKSFTITKPDFSEVGLPSYGVDAGDGIDTSYMTTVYVQNSVKKVNVTLNTKQQNETLTIISCEHTHDVNGKEIASPTNVEKTGPVKNSSTLTKWTATIGAGTDSDLPVGTTTVEFEVTNINPANNTEYKKDDYKLFIIRADDSEARLKTLTLGDLVNGFDSLSNGDQSFPVTTGTGKLTLNAVAISKDATITVGVKHSDDVIETVESSNWNSIQEVDVANVKSDKYQFEKTDCKFEGGTYLYTIVVTSGNTSGDKIVHTYKILVKVDLDTDATLASFKSTQYGTGTDATYTHTVLGEYVNTTYVYTKAASLDYVGSIKITAVKNDSKATLSTPTVELCDAADSANGVAISGDVTVSEGSVTVPYSYYKEHGGKYLRISYTVTAEYTKITKTYKLNIELPALTQVTGTAAAANATDYTQATSNTYTYAMAYKFGSTIGDEASSLKGYFGGLDVMGGKASSGTVSTWYVSSFAQSGWQYVVKVGNTDYWVQLGTNGVSSKFYTLDANFNPTEVSNPGITLTITPTIEYDGTGADATPYLILKHVLNNTSGKTVKLGAVIDTLVGTVGQSTDAVNDSVSVTSTNNGFNMAANGYKFSVILQNASGVDNVTRFWHGTYSNSSFGYLNAFSNSGDGGSGDSAASYSWDLGSETSYTRTIRISMMPTN